MFVPLGNDQTINVSRTIWRPARCQHCGCEFAYPVNIEASSTTFAYYGNEEKAKAESRERAERELEHLAYRQMAVQPCPECGKYQDNMVQFLKRRWLRFALAASFQLVVWVMLGLRGEIGLLLLVLSLVAPLFKKMVIEPLIGFLGMVALLVGLILLGATGVLPKSGSFSPLIVFGILGLYALPFWIRYFTINPNAVAEWRKREMAKKPKKYPAMRRADFEQTVAKAQSMMRSAPILISHWDELDNPLSHPVVEQNH